jgi:hypothetical protein
MRSHPLLLLLAFAAACASPGGPPVAPAPAGEALAIAQIPTRIGDFRQIDVHRFDTPGAGTAYRYSDGSRLRSDVYVYPLAEAQRASAGAPLETIQGEAHSLLAAMPVQQAQGRFDSFELLADSIATVLLPGGPLTGSHIALRLRFRGMEQESHQHVFMLGDQFLKVRTTFPPNAATAAAMAGFVERLVVAVTTVPAAATTEQFR